jgi:5'-deoxynucleotidase YfbR-like HD superfamily hydrolase
VSATEGLYEQLTGPIRRLHHVERFSSVPVLHAENVAEHSWLVAFICILIYQDQAAMDERSPGPPDDLPCVFKDLDLGVVLPRAICHDISESMSGDIIRSFKYSSKQLAEAMRDADDKNTWRFTRELGPGGDQLYSYWRDAKSISGDRNCELLAFADVVAVVIKCAEEFWLGNRHLNAICKRAYEDHMQRLASEFEWLWRYVQMLFPNGLYTDIYRRDPQVSHGDFEEEAQR